jgi:hypothetical protein
VGIASSMKELTGNILSSSEERVRKLTQLKSETKAMRQEAADRMQHNSETRKEARQQLQKQLSQSTQERKKRVNQDLKNSQNLIKRFHTERKNGADHLNKDLKLGLEHLAGEEKRRKQEVKDTLKQIGNSRHKVSVQLRKDLAHSRLDMKKNVKHTLNGAESLVNGFRSDRSAMSSAQHKDLNANKMDRRTGVKDMLDDFSGTRGKVRNELDQASRAWKGIRSHGIPEIESKPVIKSKSKSNLEGSLLKVISQQAKGITLSDAAHILGLKPVVLGKAARALINGAKVRKEGKVYLPVNGG